MNKSICRSGTVSGMLIVFVAVQMIITSSTQGDPLILSADSAFQHMSTLEIRGEDFGTKNPAAPLIWDDGENRTVNDPSQVRTAGWVDPWPSYGISNEHIIQYRPNFFRNVLPPHPRSTKHLAGGHYQDPDNNPAYIGGPDGGPYKNVMVTADAGSGMPRWFATFYYRIDPLWTTPCEPNWNHKTSTVQSGGAAYTPAGGFSYTNYRNSYPPCSFEPRFNWHAIGGADGGTWPDDYPITNNPINQWVRYEERIADDNVLGFRDTYIDNENAVQFQSNYPNWFNGQGGSKASGIRSYTVGGYFRWATDIDNTSTYRGGINNFRYFDDIYVDTTLSRVVLANSASYENATIIEPQIPFNWSNSTISIMVNLGKLPASGTAYLFVFDSDNRRNGTGFAITLADSGNVDLIAPTAPQAFDGFAN